MNDADTTAPQADDVADQDIVLDDDESQATTTEAAEASDTENTQPDPTGDESVEANAETDKHTWLKNKGIDPADPDALDKVEQKWREAEQGFHQGRQQTAKSQLKEQAMATVKADDYEDPVQAELRQIRLGNMVRDFYDEYPEAKQFDDEMAETIKTRPHLAGDLEAVYALVRSKKSESQLKEAETRGREAAKAEIARASSAAMPKGNASGTTPTEAKDPDLEAFEREFE